MKTYSKDGKTWFEKRDGKTYVGFTKAFIESLDGCWHILPAAGKQQEIKEEQPLCAVETNDGLFSVASPVSGVISVFENAAMNFPEKLKEEQHVATLSEKVVEEMPLDVVLNAEEGRPFAVDRVALNRYAAQIRRDVPMGQLNFFDDQPAVARPQGGI